MQSKAYKVGTTTCVFYRALNNAWQYNALNSIVPRTLASFRRTINSVNVINFTVMRYLTHGKRRTTKDARRLQAALTCVPAAVDLHPHAHGAGVVAVRDEPNPGGCHGGAQLRGHSEVRVLIALQKLKRNIKRA